MKGCSVPIGKHGIPCGRMTQRMCIVACDCGTKRLEHRCNRHSKKKDVTESMTYKQWRKL